MQFKDIVGQRVLINNLTKIIDSGRVSHAQLLVGPMGYGTMAVAMAYIQYLYCEHKVHYAEGAELRADSCGECPSCKKIANFMHPDVHLFFPTVVLSSSDKTDCDEYRKDFADFMQENKMYATVNDWYRTLGAENKQGTYREKDSEEIVKKLSMKSYEGRYKTIVLWMPELMPVKIANELLKSLEEPYDNTLILLVGESDSRMLPTVMSRVQSIRVNAITDGGLPEEAEGDYIEARREKEGAEDLGEFNTLFVEWMRLLFKLKMDMLSKLVDEIAALGRERQKAFLSFVLNNIRRCFEETMGVKAANLETGDEKFDKMFPSMITARNVEAITESLNEAIYSIERNVYGKVVFMNLSFALSRHIKNR